MPSGRLGRRSRARGRGWRTRGGERTAAPRGSCARAPARPTSRRPRPATSSAAGPGPTGWPWARARACTRTRSCCSAAKTKVALVAVELFAIAAGLQEDVARAAQRPRLRQDDGDAGGLAHALRARRLLRTTRPTTPRRRASRRRPTPTASSASSTRRRPTRSSTRSWSSRSPRRSGGPTRTAARPRPPGAARELHGLTENRSIEAHLARPRHQRLARAGRSAGWTRTGASHTIDPDVDVLRVDKVVKREGKTAPHPDRRVLELRRPRHGRAGRDPGVLAAITTPRPGACSPTRSARRGRRPGRPDGRQRLPQRRRGRPDRRAASTRASPARSSVGTTRGRRDVRGLEGAPGKRLTRTPRPRRALDPLVLLRPQTATGPVDGEGRARAPAS